MIMTARATTLALALLFLTAASAAAQSTNTEQSGQTTTAPGGQQIPAGFEIPPFPPNARVDKAKREAEERRREYEAAVARSRGETVEEEAPQPASRRQTPARGIEWFAGYAALHDGTSDLNFPLGWAVSLSAPFNDTFDVVGEVSGSYKNLDALGVDVGGTSVHTFTAGPKISKLLQHDVRAFAQMQGGLAVGRVTALGVGETSTGLAIVPGGGVDVPLVHGFDVRVGGELTFVHDDGWWKGFRFLTGIVVRR
jgi:hypothetical protein